METRKGYHLFLFLANSPWNPSTADGRCALPLKPYFKGQAGFAVFCTNMTFTLGDHFFHNGQSQAGSRVLTRLYPVKGFEKPFQLQRIQWAKGVGDGKDQTIVCRF